MKKNPKTLTSEEIARLEKKIMDYSNKPKAEKIACRNYLVVQLMLEAGLRVGEVGGLQVQDIIYATEPKQALRVRAEIAKTKVERTIPVSAKLTWAIQWWYRITYAGFVPNGIRPILLSRRTAKNITTRQIERIVGTISMLGIGRHINPHVLRHTFATRLMRVSSMRVVQQLLGHSSIKTTQIYTHPNGDDLKTAISKI